MESMINEMNAQMSVQPLWVQHWMNWMGAVFLTSIVFVWGHKAARCVLLTIALTMPMGLLIFTLSDTVHLLGIGHMLLWTPLCYYLWRVEIRQPEFTFKSVYGIWLALLIATMVISLVFDIRDVTLVFAGHK